MTNEEQKPQGPALEQNEEINLADVLMLVRANWKWFACSVLACLVLAAFYLASTPRTYSRKATVLIRDEDKGGGGIGESAVFGDLSLLGGTRNVDNEVLVFQARSLMEEVVRRLSLDMSYVRREGLRPLELYTQSPVRVSFPDAEPNQYIRLAVTPEAGGKARLGELRMSVGGEELSSRLDSVAAMGDTVSTEVGRIVVQPTLYYTEDCHGRRIKVQKLARESVVDGCMSTLSVSLASKTATIINLEYKDQSVSRAEDLLNTLIAVYNEDAINDKNQIAVNTSNFIDERLAIIEKELGSVDADIESYKRENQLTDIVSETGMYLQTTSRYQQEGLSLENQLSLAEYIREYLHDPSRASDLIPANTGITDTGVEAQIGEYNETLLKRDRLVAGSSDRNPVVMDLNNSLVAMRQSIIRSVDNLIVGLEINLRNLREQERRTTGRIEAVPTQQRYVLSVERQQKIKEELYLYLLNKREENALTQAITESNARIIDPASGSSRPVSPRSMVVLLAAVVLGAAFPAGLFWLLNLLDTKIHSRRDIEQALSIPFLGDIPQNGDKPRKGSPEHQIVVRESGRDSVSEAFRIIRTNMDFMRVKSPNLQVVMFTSTNPGAGKTFVSSNLAMSIAQMNKRVVIMDVDIRKGTLSGLFSNPGGRMGLTNYLSGRTDSVDDIVGPCSEYGKLDVIFAGPVPPNPAELLMSPRFDRLIGELRGRYDYIIIDNVPAGVVADASIVNRVADLTIYVVRAGVMDRRQLPELENLYRQGKLRNMALVLNGVSYTRKGYGYG